MANHPESHDSEDMRRDREMLANPDGHGSSPGPAREATDTGKAQQPFPTPGEEHLSPVDEDDRS